uniref:Uncharacterized protein n=1 Tax=Triticum urartu TaxID=4572 RepID=A0A8R7ULQ6_TRIUA
MRTEGQLLCKCLKPPFSKTTFILFGEMRKSMHAALSRWEWCCSLTPAWLSLCLWKHFHTECPRRPSSASPSCTYPLLQAIHAPLLSRHHHPCPSHQAMHWCIC